MNNQADLISGIYNFCDTWCERCLFTSRCRSFQLQSEAGLAKPMVNGDNIVQQLTDALNLTKKYLENLKQANGLSGTDVPTSEQTSAMEAEAARREVTRRHPVTVLANDYLQQTGVWLKEEANLLEQAGHQQLRAVELGLRTQEEAMPILNELKDAWEMIRWYRTLIPIKTQSALRLLTEPTADDKLTAYHLGKAKLVLVSIDQSLLAWQTMLRHYPEKMDELLDLLSLLSRLRRELEALFPEARAFKRPGLD